MMNDRKDLCQLNECVWYDYGEMDEGGTYCNDAYHPCKTNYNSTACVDSECSWRDYWGGGCEEFACGYAPSIEKCHDSDSIYAEKCVFVYNRYCRDVETACNVNHEEAECRSEGCSWVTRSDEAGGTYSKCVEFDCANFNDGSICQDESCVWDETYEFCSSA